MACGCKSKDDMIVEVIKIWSNVIWNSPEEKKEANRRVEVCLTSGKNKDKCIHNKDLYCRQSGLWIPAMARNMKRGCPINKWQ